MTPLCTIPNNGLAPVLGLRHRQNPQARPPAPKLPQPWVDLVHVAPPTSVHSGCVGYPVLKRAGLEVQQLVGVALSCRKQGKSGTLPSIFSQGATYRTGVGDGSYSLVVALCMGPVAGNFSSSKVLKKTRQASMSSGPRVQVGIMGWISCDMQVLPWTTWDYLRVHFVKTVLGQWAFLGIGRSYP